MASSSPSQLVLEYKEILCSIGEVRGEKSLQSSYTSDAQHMWSWLKCQGKDQGY